jgi:hypothetical protein
MATDFQRVRFMFPSRTGSAQSLEQTVYFPTAVQKAEAVINGFNIGFTNSDRELYRQQVDATVTRIYVGSVTVRVDFALRDKSGTFDDAYDGYVDVVVLVNRA